MVQKTIFDKLIFFRNGSCVVLSCAVKDAVSVHGWEQMGNFCILIAPLFDEVASSNIDLFKFLIMQSGNEMRLNVD